MLLTLLIGFKTVAPVLKGVKVFSKEASSGIQNDGDEEKKPESNVSPEKEKQFASIYSYDAHCIIYAINIKHYTNWCNNYQSCCYTKITIPPPDLI